MIILISLFIYFTGNSSSSTQGEYESHNSSKRLKTNCNIYRSIMFSVRLDDTNDNNKFKYREVCRLFYDLLFFYL